MRERIPAVYILTGQTRGTLYIGVTSDPLTRLLQHREEMRDGFTSCHGVKRLVHIDFFGDMENAIRREKQLKNWKREWKIALIQKDNPDWRDLAPDSDWKRWPSCERGIWMPDQVRHDGEVETHKNSVQIAPKPNLSLTSPPVHSGV